MQIALTLSASMMGENTDDDNRRYEIVVREALHREYPGADLVQVFVSAEPFDRCWVSDDPTGEIAANVYAIANSAWVRASR